jgi:hypothetical protein
MDLNWILANYDKLTPEEKWLAQKEFGGGSGGFYFVLPQLELERALFR